jgi:hypothetical protein
LLESAFPLFKTVKKKTKNIKARYFILLIIVIFKFILSCFIALIEYIHISLFALYGKYCNVTRENARLRFICLFFDLTKARSTKNKIQ